MATINENAVAPDWNLKIEIVNKLFEVGENAVAPDWNLKSALILAFSRIRLQCSRTRLEFKAQL